MAYQEVGHVLSGKTRKRRRVKWDPDTGNVQVDSEGFLGRGISTYHENAKTPRQALQIAEYNLRNE